MNNWSPLHHAVDASSYSVRASLAAKQLIPLTPVEVINAQTTGSQPRGYTCLHFACDGSSRDYSRWGIAKILIAKKADLETQASKGNTPLLYASGVGITDVVNLFALLAACGDVDLAPIPMASFSKEAIALIEQEALVAGSQPSPSEKTVHYMGLLKDCGLIAIPADFMGRKPSATRKRLRPRVTTRALGPQHPRERRWPLLGPQQPRQRRCPLRTLERSWTM